MLFVPLLFLFLFNFNNYLLIKTLILHPKIYTSKKMKKIYSIVLVAGVGFLVACGPSKEELAKKEQARLDSIALVEKTRLDSVQAAEAEKAKQDSLAAALEKVKQDSIEAASKKGGKKKPVAKVEPKKEEPKKEEPKTGLGAGKGGTTAEPAKLGEGKAGTTPAKGAEPQKLGQGKGK
jgi:hypothetical protein